MNFYDLKILGKALAALSVEACTGNCEAKKKRNGMMVF